MNEYEIEEAFNEMLDESYPLYVMGELTVRPSQILKNCDPTAYRCYLSDYSSMIEDDE